MGVSRLTKLVNGDAGRRVERKDSLARALETVVSALNLQNGRLTIFVRHGKPSPRVEIHSCISQDLEG